MTALKKKSWWRGYFYFSIIKPPIHQFIFQNLHKSWLNCSVSVPETLLFQRNFQSIFCRLELNSMLNNTAGVIISYTLIWHKYSPNLTRYKSLDRTLCFKLDLRFAAWPRPPVYHFKMWVYLSRYLINKKVMRKIDKIC